MTALSVGGSDTYNALLYNEPTLLTAGEHIEQTVKVIESIDQHGVTPTTWSLLRSHQFLDSSALDVIAVESMSSKSCEDNLAIEALINAADEKAAAWSARIVHILSSAGTTLLAIIKPVMDKILDLSEDVKAKLKDKAFDTQQVIKAHPARTVLALVGSVTAAMGVLAFCGSSMPGGTASREMFLAFFGKVSDMISHIPWPFGKIESHVGPTGSVSIPVVPMAKPVRQTAERLGWTGPTVEELASGSARAAKTAVRGTTSFAWRAAKFVTMRAIPKAFTWGNGFRRHAPHAVYKLTRSKAMGHATYLGLTALFYAFCYKVFLIASKILWEVVTVAGIAFKMTLMLFL